MNVTKYRTNLNCGSCVEAVKPHLNGERSIRRWSVDTSNPMKTLMIEGENVPRQTVERLVGDAGFKVLGPIESETPPAAEPKASLFKTYYPLLLVVGFLFGFVAYAEYLVGSFDVLRAMNKFMGAFFIAFAFFKLLDVRGFADAFQTYDLAARRFPFYALAYPFIELALGIAYLGGFTRTITNGVTLLVMSVGLVGVTQALLAKRSIQCACLGTVFKLPMSYVTFVEDALMAGMAIAMLATHRSV